MRNSVTVDELIAAFDPKIRSIPSTKPRDPVEGDHLRKLGDPNGERNQAKFVRVAGERPTAANVWNRFTVSTIQGDQIRCIRPEAFALDRLALTAGRKVPETVLQAAAVVANRAWDQDWIEQAAVKAGLGRIWSFLRTVLERGDLSGDVVDKAIGLGLDP